LNSSQIPTVDPDLEISTSKSFFYSYLFSPKWQQLQINPPAP